MSDEIRTRPAPSEASRVTGDSPFDRVRALVVRLAGPDRTPASIDSETPLGEHGFNLDSVELLEVMLACEGELGMTFDSDPTASVRALQTLGTLTSAVRAKLGQ